MNRIRLIPMFAALTFALPAQDETKPQDKPKDAPKSEAPDEQKGNDAGKADKVDFVTQVLPILEKSCVECHKAPHTGADGKPKKPKGGVTMDSRAAMEKSKKGKVVVAGKPDDSLLYHSISLPADDEDRMPPAKKGDPLPQDQIDLIKKWIEQGADYGTWTGADAKSAEKGGDEKAKEPAKEDAKKEQPKNGSKGDLAQLEAGLAPLPQDAIDALRARFSVEAFAVDSALLRVSAHGREATVDDAAVAALAPAKEHIAELVLARTHVTDACMVHVAAMPRLVHLDLRATKVGDAGAAQLGAARELRSVNLVGSEVGDRGLAALSACAKLRNVYVWQTTATATAIVALQQSLPSARVVFTADLPTPMADADASRNRRR